MFYVIKCDIIVITISADIEFITIQMICCNPMLFIRKGMVIIMLDRIELDSSVEKEEFKQNIEACRGELIRLEQEMKKHKIPVIIVFEGWGASGKGTMISQTIAPLDPRSFNVYSTIDADEAEERKPLMWRFWRNIPEKGRMSILDRSWYQETAFAKLEKDIGKQECQRRLDLINTFERQLTDDGYLIIKLFLHISKNEQKKRFKKLEESKSTSWRVTLKDIKQNKRYDKFYDSFDNMLDYTNTTYAPWTVVPANDRNTSVLTIYKTIISSLNAAIDGKREVLKNETSREIEKENFTLLKMPKLSEYILDRTISDEKYDNELKKQQKILSKLHSRLYAKKIPVIIAYEGWDAAGKGGNIRRIASALDPRGYEAVPIAAPDKHELSRHYLWRFWNKIPKSGHIAIFDRTWYGRVMVERIEGFTPESRWSQAYQEINEFEKEFSDNGGVVLKFWLHIDKEEQLKRFNERQTTPEKQWKITDEDWRNREKWDEYEVAVDEMIKKTTTDFSPWYIIEANDKKFARIKTLKIINEVLKRYLNEDITAEDE